jgi:hypothetical protein
VFPSSHCSACDLIPSPQIPTQFTSTPVQTPFWQVVTSAQLEVAVQEVPLGFIVSAGQAELDPSQVSAGSQIEVGSLEALQTVPLATLVSDEQVDEFPGQ